MMDMFIVHSARRELPARRSRLRFHRLALCDRSRHSLAARFGDDRFQHVDLEQPGFSGIDPLPIRLGNKVRVRMANLTMTNHPMHLHGHRFAVSCTDGGWVPESAAIVARHRRCAGR